MLQERPATTRSTPATSGNVKLDAEAQAVWDWLIDVCTRSSSGESQVFIFRDSSLINKLFRRHKAGEVKAVAMSDLVHVHRNQIRALQNNHLITPCKGRWPGKWFTVNRG